MKIKVNEAFRLNAPATVLICELFPNEIVTTVLESNIGKHRDFVVFPIRSCFSPAKSRNIVLVGNTDYSGIKHIRFIDDGVIE